MADLIRDNKTAYELAALSADAYLGYKYESGAGAQHCSNNGQKICKILSRLAQETRSFTNPEREDLKKLSQDAQLAFRNFDLSGNVQDGKAFVNSLINLLKALLPLLSETKASEARGLIELIQNASS